MATEARAGNFKISHAPLVSSAAWREPAPGEAAQLPAHYGPPLLLAIARNPRTLLVCWSVDWATAFGSDVPPDRKAHVKLRLADSERTHAVEPLSGNCLITDLEPGETYLVEIGYFAPANRWNLITSGNEVMMPLDRVPSDDAPVDVATVPFHLSFQRLVDLFGEDPSALVQALAGFEKRAAQDVIRSEKDEQLLRALDLSRDDLQTLAAARDRLQKLKRRSSNAEKFGGSSFGGSNWNPARPE
jgi:Domain of unknown function (DUF4912)